MAAELLAVYDSEGKGWLSEEEGLLMMADVDELNEPPSTRAVMRLLDDVLAQATRLSEPIDGLERNLRARRAQRSSTHRNS